jgi:hypothetical protein
MLSNTYTPGYGAAIVNFMSANSGDPRWILSAALKAWLARARRRLRPRHHHTGFGAEDSSRTSDRD